MNEEDKLGILAGLTFVLSPEEYKKYKGSLNKQLEEKDKEIQRLNNIINELEKDTIELMKSYKDVNAPRYDMCKHFIYKLTELKENKDVKD